MKLIAIDAGNTRIKWGVHDGAIWIARGALPTSEAASLSEVSAGWPGAARIVACNVAGQVVEERHWAHAFLPRYGCVQAPEFAECAMPMISPGAWAPTAGRR